MTHSLHAVGGWMWCGVTSMASGTNNVQTATGLIAVSCIFNVLMTDEYLVSGFVPLNAYE